MSNLPVILDMPVCSNPDVLRVIYFGLLILDIVKIIIPIGLIIMGMIDFSKSVITSDEGAQKKNVSLLMKRILNAVLVFAVPWIVELVIVSLGNLTEGVNFTDCLENARKLGGVTMDPKKYKCFYQKSTGKYEWIYTETGAAPGGPGGEFTEVSKYKNEKDCKSANETGNKCLYNKNTRKYVWMHVGEGTLPQEIVNEGFTIAAEYKLPSECEAANNK